MSGRHANSTTPQRSKANRNTDDNHDAPSSSSRQEHQQQQQSSKQKAATHAPTIVVHKGCSATGFLIEGIVLASVVVIVFAVLNHYATHVFDPALMKSIANESLAAHPEDLDKQIAFVVDKLRAAYPGHIIEHPEWMFNNAGGAMGSMLVLHCSISEYVIIFGTPVGTEGHTGRFFADDYFTILHGEQWAFAPGQLHREIYRPGEQHHLEWMTAKQYRMDEACWALEYARGSIPSMLPFGLWDTLFSTLDVVTFAKTVRVSALSMFKELVAGKI